METEAPRHAVVCPRPHSYNVQKFRFKPPVFIQTDWAQSKALICCWWHVLIQFAHWQYNAVTRLTLLKDSALPSGTSRLSEGKEIRKQRKVKGTR
jgi:hypothetical protein